MKNNNESSNVLFNVRCARARSGKNFILYTYMDERLFSPHIFMYN